MTPDQLFSLAGTAAMTGWTVLILGPRRFALLSAVPHWIIPGAIAGLYALLVLRHMASAQGGFDSLASVALLFGNEWMLLAGWVHFLAFDLFVGAVMAARMDQAGIGRLVQAPILAAIFLLGPLGFLLAALTELALRAGRLPALSPITKDARHGAA